MTKKAAVEFIGRYDVPAEIERIQRELDQLRFGLRQKRAALHKHLAKMSSGGSPDLEFYAMRPLDATREVIAAAGGSIKREKLEEELIRGGLTVRRKRGVHNIRISLDLNLRNGNLVAEGDCIRIGSRNEPRL